MLCQVAKVVSQLSTIALHAREGKGFLLSDDEARQYVYNGLDQFAADNDHSPDDSSFNAVRFTILCSLRD